MQIFFKKTGRLNFERREATVYMHYLSGDPGRFIAQQKFSGKKISLNKFNARVGK